jgi:dihydroorotate dehydrogenase
MQSFYEHEIQQIVFNFSEKWQRSLWGLKFRLPLMNSAGMFKNGEGYNIVANQGAGGYIGGTSTGNPRTGNIKHGITHPFISLPKSHATLNYLGLPNQGDEVLAKKIITPHKVDGCPIGWSVMRSPDYEIAEKLYLKCSKFEVFDKRRNLQIVNKERNQKAQMMTIQSIDKLIQSLWLYHDNQHIDFIEINESCPNIKVDAGDITKRLYYIAENFLTKRTRKLPVILKLSNDLSLHNLPKLLDVVFECKFDGINLGNTSTDYIDARKSILDQKEQQFFDYFISNFGGGLGGDLLKTKSLALCAAAVNYREIVKPNYEFHIIRTGGINRIQDILDSNNAGITLNQWYTGYFDNYITHGDKLYSKLFT